MLKMLASQLPVISDAALRDEFGFLPEDYQSVLETIYSNQYFTNHGPLARKLEASLERFLRIDHVIAIGSQSLAVLVAIAGLELSKEIIVPAFPDLGIAQIARKTRLSVRFADVDRLSHQPVITQLESVLTSETEAVVLIETWGNRCDQKLVDVLVSRGLRVIVIAFDSLAARIDNQLINPNPNVVSVLSFGKSSLVCTLTGGAVATNNEKLAHKFRNIRSSYGVQKKMDVVATCNGRISEAQAGIGLLSLENLENVIELCSRNFGYCLEEIGRQPRLSAYRFSQTDVQNNLILPLVCDHSVGSPVEAKLFPVAHSLSNCIEALSMKMETSQLVNSIKQKGEQLEGKICTRSRSK